MTKTEFVLRVAQLSNLPLREARNAVEAIFSTDQSRPGVIAQALSNAERIVITGFGSFTVKHRLERPGRNPRTGEVVDIPAASIPVFRPGKNLKRIVDQ